MNYQISLTRSNPVSPDPRVERVVSCLKNTGYVCKIFAWTRNRSEKTKKKCSDSYIERFYFSGKYGGGIVNLFGLFFFNLWLFFRHLIIRPQVIHAFDLDTVLPALMARVFTKSKLVYDIADWYADSRKVGPFRSLVDRLEKWVCSTADLVILAHEIRIQQVGSQPKHWIVIYNTPDDITIAIRNEKSHNEKYFAYVGILQEDRAVPHIIESAMLAKCNLIIAGFGPLDELCQIQAAKNKNITFLGRIPYTEALTIEKDAIAILAFYNPCIKNNKFAAPNKLYEAMMLGRPIVTSSGTYLSDFVEQEKIGLVVPYGDTEALSKIFSFLYNNKEDVQNMGHRARDLYNQHYSFEQQRLKLVNAYNLLLHKYP